MNIKEIYLIYKKNLKNGVETVIGFASTLETAQRVEVQLQPNEIRLIDKYRCNKVSTTKE